MLKWVLTLLVSMIGALVVEEYSGTIKRVLGSFRDALARVRAVLIGAIVGMTFLAGFLFAEELPWSLILDVAPLFGAGVVTTWAAYMLWRIDRTTRMLERIARDRHRPDGGALDGDGDDDSGLGEFDADGETSATTGSGAIAGATMGGAIGSLLGPQGAFAGAVIGASLGDSLEADANEERR